MATVFHPRLAFLLFLGPDLAVTLSPMPMAGSFLHSKRRRHQDCHGPGCGRNCH